MWKAKIVENVVHEGFVYATQITKNCLVQLENDENNICLLLYNSTWLISLTSPGNTYFRGNYYVKILPAGTKVEITQGK